MTIELTRKQMRLLGYCGRCAVCSGDGRPLSATFAACGERSGAFCPSPPPAARDWFELIGGRVEE